MKDLKKIVRDKYAKIALQEQKGCGESSSCCGPANEKEEYNNIMAESYESLDGYNVDADLGLGVRIAYRVRKNQTRTNRGGFGFRGR